MSFPVPSSVAAGLIPAGLVAAAVVYGLVQALLLAYAGHRWVVLARWLRAARARHRVAPEPAPPGGDWPVVTVQLPIYREPAVTGRLVAAVAALDYPRDRLEIQVLDDSEGPATAIAAAAVARHRAAGLDIVHLVRRRRTGYKAGALAAGLARARGELLAVFDADFVPPPDFLRRLVPAFADPGVGMVQARWGHLNRGRSWLTAAQAMLLDAHFTLEHGTRAGSGLFFNFNGTAGVWRRACIEDAGGWSDDTLTEDLDLSYRAQLRGWRFVFRPDLVVPGELPAGMRALRSQQRRWVRGSIQTARKLLPRVLAAPLPVRVRVEAFFHLTSNVAWPLLLALGLLLLPALLAPGAAAPAWLVATLHAAVLVLGMLPVMLFLVLGRLAAGGRPAAAVRDLSPAIALGIGLSLANTRAVLAGLRPGGAFERTPKTGDHDGAGRAAVPPAPAPPWREGTGELLLAAWFALAAALAWRAGTPRAAPFLALLIAGFAAVGLESWREARAGRPGQRATDG